MKTILELETRGLRAVGLFVLVAVLALGAPGALAETASSRLLAIGDIHGDYEALVAILQEAHIVDFEGNWVAGDTVLGPDGRPSGSRTPSAENHGPSDDSGGGGPRSRVAGLWFCWEITR